MEFLEQLIDVFLHLDKHLDALIVDHGAWAYAILAAVIFAETGLVFTPFLPGDSLLFAAGALAARGSLDLALLALLLSAAAIAGDTVNYWIGKALGRKMLDRPNPRLIKRSHVEKTHAFFEKYGGKTIVIARFVPIVRTFAPFVAGIGAMNYSRFILFNVIGGILWVVVCLAAGYLFGGLPVVKDNFSLVVLAIIVISILPIVFEVMRAKREAAR